MATRDLKSYSVTVFPEITFKKTKEEVNRHVFISSTTTHSVIHSLWIWKCAATFHQTNSSASGNAESTNTAHRPLTNSAANTFCAWVLFMACIWPSSHALLIILRMCPEDYYNLLLMLLTFAWYDLTLMNTLDFS